MKKYEILKYGLILIMFGLVLTIRNVSGSQYTENYEFDNTFIDGSKDSFYDLEYNGTDKVYFAYSESRYAIFIETNESIVSLRVNETIISGDLQDINMICKIVGSQAEFIINKTVHSNPIFLLTVNNHSSIILDPFDLLIPPPTEPEPEPQPEPEPEPERRKGIEVDLLQWSIDVFSSPGVWIFIAFFILIIADYQNHPIVKCEGPDGKVIKLGRFITETDEPELNLKKFLFMCPDGIRTVYCRYTFRGLDAFQYQRVYVIHWDYPHLLLMTLNVPENRKIENDRPLLPERKLMGKSKKKANALPPLYPTPHNPNEPIPMKNRVYFRIFKIFCFTPFRQLALKLYEAMKKEKVQMEKVNYLVPWLNMDAIEYRFNVTYELYELDAKDGEHKWISHEMSNVCYNDILSIKKLTNIQKIAITLHDVKKITFAGLKEAQEYKRSLVELITANENNTVELENQILDLNYRLTESHNINRNQKLELDQKVEKAIKPFEDANEILRSNFPDMLSNALNFRNIGQSEIDAIQNAIKIHIDKNDQHKNDLLLQIAELNVKIKGLETRLSRQKEQFNPNVIVFPNKNNQQTTGENAE